MLVCTKKEVYKYLKKEKVNKLYLIADYRDEDIDFLISKINKNEEEGNLEVNYVDKKTLDKMMNNENHGGIIADVPDNSIIIILFLIIASVLLFFIVLGISFSMFETTLKGENPTGSIIVNYSDINGQGNGISITDAVPVADQVGTLMVGSGNYFDFIVSGITSNIPMKYYIVANKEVISTLGDNNVKVYLTSNDDMIESALFLPKLYSSLDEKIIEDNSYKLLYTKELEDTNNQFSDKYRFRMWISDSADDYFNKTFSVKLNVFAEGIGE